jgi:hypothetical protein
MKNLKISNKKIDSQKQNKKKTNMTNKLNCCAHNITKPTKRPQRQRFTMHGDITRVLDMNRKGIALLRKRKFTWTQIHQCLQKIGVDVDYNNLYQWQVRRFR